MVKLQLKLRTRLQRKSFYFSLSSTPLKTDRSGKIKDCSGKLEIWRHHFRPNRVIDNFSGRLFYKFCVTVRTVEWRFFLHEPSLDKIAVPLVFQEQSFPSETSRIIFAGLPTINFLFSEIKPVGTKLNAPIIHSSPILALSITTGLQIPDQTLFAQCAPNEQLRRDQYAPILLK